MYYEVSSKRNIVDDKGNDKEVVEKFIIDNCELCAEAEVAILGYFNNENTCVSVKESSIKEFVNSRKDEDEYIFLANIESTFVDDSGNEKVTKYTVGIFDKSVESATQSLVEYMKQGMDDLRLASVKKTKICDVIDYREYMG